MILRLHDGRRVLPLDVILVTHVDEAADLVLRENRGGYSLSDGISSEVKRLGVEAAK